MASPKILVIPGSLRAGSYNVKLAALMVKELTLLDVEVTRISLEDYPLPIYDANLENKAGPPANALALKQMIGAHQGVFFASPEYNASINPLTKNSIDWVSRVRERNDPPLAAFKGRVFALGSAAPGPFGGMRGLLALRQSLEIGCGAFVIPDQISVMNAGQAFNEKDELADTRAASQLRNVAQKLIDTARLMT
ncbi:MAG: NADPH-dependent FMN reductase [Xanthobacteraceae bacterium]